MNSKANQRKLSRVQTNELRLDWKKSRTVSEDAQVI